jgi:anti-sigma factor RsiW
MCEYSPKLIAWLDRELPEQDAAHIEAHMAQCEECRSAAARYQEISRSFLICYEAAMVEPMVSPRGSKRRFWIPALAGVAAAIFVLAAVFWTRPVQQLSLRVPPSAPAPAMAFVLPSARNTVRARPKPPRTQWMIVEPSVQVELPADALFPPGAVPAGVSFIADVRP